MQKAPPADGDAKYSIAGVWPPGPKGDSGLLLRCAMSPSA